MIKKHKIGRVTLGINGFLIAAGLLLLTQSNFAQIPAELVLNSPGTAGTYGATTRIILANGYSYNGINGPVTFKIVPLAVNCVPLNATPTSGQNYIQTLKPRIALTDASTLALKNVCEVMQTIQYIDGLGRLIQTVQVKGNNDATKDVIQPIAYDDFGRETFKYLPYATAAGTPGSYRTDALDPGGYGQPHYYTLPPSGVVYTNTPYSKTIFEPSELNRVLELGAPGDAWQPAAGHAKKIVYDVNIANNVRYYTAEAVATSGLEYQRTLADNGFFTAGELYLTISKDENWVSSDGKAGTVEEYKDKEGRVILKRTYNFNTDVTPNVLEPMSTYYVYDFKGNLSFVLPPGANPDAGGVVQANIDKFGYQYRYDGRGRLIEKRIAGKGWDYMVYNTDDDLVLSQDAEQHKTNKWLFTKYDKIGRLIMTGVMTSADSRLTLQSTVNAGINIGETRDASTGTGYTENAFPYTGINNYLTINYYDDYAFPGASGLTATAAHADINTGLLTGSRVYKTDGSASYTTANYYDAEGRVVETMGQNHLAGTNRRVNTYNFIGELLTTTHTNTVSGATTTIADTYIYDHMGRKVQTKQSINAATAILLSELHYNVLGQLITKKLHSIDEGISFLNTTNYTYNPRGWLKTQTNPLFNLTLSYEDSAPAQYNGNISKVAWGTHNYTYLYDKVNRLTSGVSDENFNEVLTYDVMGNIKTLKRNLADLNTYAYTDGNRLAGITGANPGTYHYDDNGNVDIDGVKGVNISYNYLNLPVTITKGANQMQNTWLATGNKIKKVVGSLTRDYVGEIEYNNGVIDIIHTEEGRAVPAGGGAYTYDYFIKDHLGNTRVLLKQDGTVLESTDYYPFGMTIARAGTVPSPENRYKYNGKELQTELGLGQYDYGARFYDPAVGRWSAVDPLAEDYAETTGYNYVNNNPIIWIDPDGMAPIREDFSGSGADDGTGASTDDDEDPKKKIISLKEVIIHSAPKLDPFTGFWGYVNYQWHGGNFDGFHYDMNGNATGLAPIMGIVPDVSKYGSLKLLKASGLLKILNPKNWGKSSKLFKAASQLEKNGMSAAARALQKHGDRAGSLFPKISGNAAAVNNRLK